MNKTKHKKGDKVTFVQHPGITASEHGIYEGDHSTDSTAKCVRRLKPDNEPRNNITPVWGKIQAGWK